MFAIEALGLIDHFDFLNRCAAAKAAAKRPSRRSVPPASKRRAAAEASWFLPASDAWTAPYFDADDLHCVDRMLFC